MSALEDSYSESDDSDDSYKWSELFEQGVHGVCITVDESFIEDDFNLVNLPNKFRNFSRLMEIILDDYFIENDSVDPELDADATSLYCLIHQRYVLTAAGLDAASDKFASRKYPPCPRSECYNCPMIPHGLSDTPFISSLHFLCPSCDQVYSDRKYKNVDGCLYGTSFAAFFRITHSNLIAEYVTNHADVTRHVPTLFGYKIHPTSPYFYRKPTSDESI